MSSETLSFATNGELIEVVAVCLAELIRRGNKELQPAHDAVGDFRANHQRLAKLASSLAEKFSDD